MNTGTWRQRALLAGLAVTVVLSALPGGGDDATVVAVRPVAAKAHQPTGLPARAAPASKLELERLRRQAAAEEVVVGNAFGSISWYVPPPPPPPVKPLPPPPPPPPSPPPMPFSYLGHYQDGATLIIMLTKGDRIYTVSEGAVIDNTYRVERVRDGQLELTYLPLNMKQIIKTG